MIPLRSITYTPLPMTTPLPLSDTLDRYMVARANQPLMLSIAGAEGSSASDAYPNEPLATMRRDRVSCAQILRCSFRAGRSSVTVTTTTN